MANRETGVSVSLAALETWRSQLGLDVVLGHNLSLVEYRVEGVAHTCFVHWTDTHTRRGRFVRLDEENRVIYSIPAMVRETDLSQARVIHANAGVRMQKVTKRFRPRVPDDILRLQRVWNSGVQPEGEDGGLCILCTQADRAAEVTSRCALCCLSWHPECAAQAATELPRHAAAHLQLRRPSWPDHLARLPRLGAGVGGLCALCDR